jgi:hypothetical protein
MEAFLSCVEIYDDSVVDAACRNITRQSREFPPSAGEVRQACEKVVSATQPYKPSQHKFSRPLDIMTPEEAAASRERVAKMIADFKANVPPPDMPYKSKAADNKKDATVAISSALFDSMISLMDK